MRQVKVEFEAMQRQAKLNGWSAKCEGNPAPYTDFPNGVLPSVNEAQELCEGCPLKNKLCFEYGYASRAGLHYPIVLGGFLWVDAKPVMVDGPIEWDQDLAA